jgi:AcrR family transcriptional regulator
MGAIPAIVRGMEQDRSQQEGWREKKRRETLQRITDSALKLFTANGYEATTLDAIAEASGIARRTFFYYFESKEEILLAWQSGMADAVRAAILAESTKQPPLDAVRNALLKLASHYNAERAISVDRIIRSNEQLRASNQAKFLQIEQAAYEALCALWPQVKRRKALRLVAMVSVGALRLAIDTWSADGGTRPLSKYLKESFDALKAEL